MREILVLNVVLSIFITVTTIFGLGHFGFLSQQSEQAEGSKNLKIAIVDLVDVTNTVAGKASSLLSEESSLDRFEGAIKQVSEELKKEGYLVIPQTVVLGYPEMSKDIVNMTERYKMAVNGSSSGGK